MTIQLKIKPEYRDLVPPQTKEEYEELKKSILENGQYAPISYNEELEVLDGHHRYKICQDLGLVPQVESRPRQFPNKLYEKLFVIDMNLQRRQLTPYVRGRLALMTKPILEEIARQRMLSGKKKDPSLTSDEGRVDVEIGKRARLGKDTIRKIEVIEKFAEEEDKQKLTQDKATVNAVFNKIEKQQAQQKILSQTPKTSKNNQLFCGDFIEQSQTIADNSIDLIFTDPPYDRKSIPLYEKLGELAQRVLKPGGSLVTYIPTYELPTVLNLLTTHLRYWWQFCIKHSGGHAHMKQRFVFVYWKPLLWFVKGSIDVMDSIEDFIQSSPPKKALHPWQQSTVEAEHVISKLTISNNQIVFDPFMGSGTTGIATTKLKRKFIGIEKDPEMFEIARREITNAM